MASKAGVRLRIAGAVMLLVGVSACSEKEAGRAEPQISPSESSSGMQTTSPNPSTPVSLSIDPCALILEEDLAEVGKFDKNNQEGGGARSCYWKHAFEDGGDGFTFAVSVRDEQSIETVNDSGSGIHESEVNQRPSVWTVDPNFDDCTFVMKLDEVSRVDITVSGDPGSDDSCEVAEVIAGMVEPNLPELP